MAGGSKMQGDIVIGNLSCKKNFTVSLKQVRSLCMSLSNVFVLRLFLTHRLQFKKCRSRNQENVLFGCLFCYFVLIFSSILEYCKVNVK